MPYTPIPDAELDPGKPGSSELFFKLRDNPEGIASGSSGAPKIQNGAFNDNSINGGKLQNNTLALSDKSTVVQIDTQEVIQPGAFIFIPKGFYNVQVGNPPNSPLRALEASTSVGGWEPIHDPLQKVAQVFSNGLSVRYSNNEAAVVTLHLRRLF